MVLAYAPIGRNAVINVDSDRRHDDRHAVRDAAVNVVGRVAQVRELELVVDVVVRVCTVQQRRGGLGTCLLYTSPSPRDGLLSRMPSSA